MGNTATLAPQFGQEFIDLITEIAAMKRVVIGGQIYRASTHGSLLVLERGKSEMHTYGPNSIGNRYCRNESGQICYKQKINGGFLGGMGGETKLIPLVKAK